ncbi:hypothetical protein [Dyadobacter sp. CY326]|uniref:hypothetical protein n=1 Tax=Dyadobacter sp. CY326 TaxID=2907300 RepID=UPI001F301415|nr:hypothetical protein [Dyadobacter sp. CY326]MCE7067206.1 hypothetical protein [Dyadobacter sp. CY326]
MGVKKFLLVCETCNSGWISENENKIKEAIGKLVLGEQIRLEDQFIPKIAAWIAIMTIMGEFMDPDERAIHRNHRNFLYKNRYPSDDWKIWIGIYEGEQTQLYRWSHIIQSDNPQDVTNPMFSPIDHPDHCQVTVITLNKLLIVSATNPAVDIDRMFTEMIYKSKHRLVQLWPRASDRVLKNLATREKFK